MAEASALATLTVDGVEALSPDAANTKNGRKLAGQAGKWSGRGRTDAALWGEFKGSGSKPYQVRAAVDAAGKVGWKCGCPSYKQPCKHTLGLLIAFAGDDATCPPADPPDWVAGWLDKRAASAKAKATKAANAAKPADPKAQAKRRAAREKKVLSGLDGLELWLDDLVRGGLAGLEADGPKAFERQAARLVDAQAGGLAARLRALSELPGAGTEWPGRLLSGLAAARLLTAAYRGQDTLPDDLKEEVRTLVGWTRKEADTLAVGERVADGWVCLGNFEWEDEKVRGLRTWLYGVETGRFAEVVQFLSHFQSGATFSQRFAAGCLEPMTLVYQPGVADAGRAVVAERAGGPVPVPLPPGVTLAELGERVAAGLAANPFRTRFPAVLAGVVPLVEPGTDDRGNAIERWWLRDPDGRGVRLVPGDWWPLLAASGGHPLSVAGDYEPAPPGPPTFRPLHWDDGPLTAEDLAAPAPATAQQKEATR